VHIDKLKAYLDTPPRFWLAATTNDDNRIADLKPATNPVTPDILIGPVMSPSVEQQPTPRFVNRRRTDAEKQKGLSHSIPNVTLPTSMVEEASSMLSDSRKAVESPSSEVGDSSAQLNTDLTLVKKVDTLPVNKISTVVKIPLTDKEPANVLEERDFQIETPTSDPTTTIAASEREKMITDAPAIYYVTTSAAVVSEGENVEKAETFLPDPTVVHATPAGEDEIGGQSVAGRSWKRNRAHPSVVRQQSQKGRNSSITVTADIHSAYDNDNSGNTASHHQEMTSLAIS